MEKFYKYGFIGALVLLLASMIGIGVYISFLRNDLNKAQENTTIAMKQLEEGIVRSESSYTNQDGLEKTLKDFSVKMDVIQKDLDQLDANMQSINVVQARTPGYTGTNLASTGTKPNPSPNPNLPTCKDGKCSDPYGYLSNEQEMKLFEPLDNKTQVPLGNVSFKAWQEKPWNVKIFPREYQIVNVISEDDDGRQIVHNQFMIKEDGKTYQVPITAKTVQKIKEGQFHFNPRLYLGVNAGATVYPQIAPTVMPQLEVSLFSYGESKYRPLWNFLNLGLGLHMQPVDGTVLPALTLSPVNYNLGAPLPLVDNLFIGPNISMDTSGNLAVTAGIKVGL